MRFSLIPREMRFFDMFDETAGKLTLAATKFVEMVLVFDKLEIRSHELKREEDACDASIEKIIKALDRTFITPFDREDIHTLATSLDDIMDNMEETSHRLEVFRIDKPTPEALELARIIKECCLRIESALKLLRDMRNSEKIHMLLREIGQLENDADKLYRKVDAALFSNLVTSGGAEHNGITPVDILTLIKWRELYGWLEDTVDACKDVANVISEIVIKGT
ncbi:MAG: DUF47 domain-containing protein [Gemmataceae bacterium]|nr:DUF47 domain-containing protein [Gemmataceae bacterium]